MLSRRQTYARWRFSSVIPIVALATLLGPAARAQGSELSAVGHRVPEFGGAWFSGGALQIWLTENSPDALDRAHKELIRVGGSQFDVAHVVGLKADYAYSQLEEWHEAAGEVFSVEGVYLLDLDERVNRLAVGITSEDARPGVAAVLQRQSIPPQAVEVLVGAAPLNQVPVDKPPRSRPLLLPLALGGLVIALGILFLTIRRSPRRGRSEDGEPPGSPG